MAERSALGLYEDVFDRHPIPTIVVAADGLRIKAANRQARQVPFLLGLPGSPIVGRPLHELSGTDRDTLARDLRIAASGARLPITLSTGTDVPVVRRYLRVAPVCTDDGQRHWLVTLDEEWPDRARFTALNRRILKANEQAASARRSQQEIAAEYGMLESFSRAMAHDLKAPLRQIQAFLTLLSDEVDEGLTDEQKSWLEMARSAAKRGHSLVGDLLRNATAGSVELSTELIDLDELVPRVARSLQSELESAVDVFSIDEPLGHVTADPTLLQQLLDNLLGNAVKYRSHDRPLEVRISSVHTSLGVASLVIEDNGIGFKPQFAATLFEPFKRLSAERSGNGIGLATCKTICNRHGWSITAYGSPRIGARFEVNFQPTRAIPQPPG